jgi:hypothetical protein
VSTNNAAPTLFCNSKSRLTSSIFQQLLPYSYPPQDESHLSSHHLSCLSKRSRSNGILLINHMKIGQPVRTSRQTLDGIPLTVNDEIRDGNPFRLRYPGIFQRRVYPLARDLERENLAGELRGVIQSYLLTSTQITARVRYKRI